MNNNKFEDKLNELQLIVEKLESHKLTLDEMVDLFENGMILMKECRIQLNTAENRINTLIDDNGDLIEKPGIVKS